MIINFSIKNFRSIREEITLSFEPISSEEEKYFLTPINDNEKLLKTALLLGPNASGKTNILYAINFLKELVIYPTLTKDLKLPLHPFKFDENKNTVFKLEFFNNTKFEYYIELNKWAVIKEHLYKTSGERELIYERTTDTKEKISQIKFGKIAENTNQDDLKALEKSTLWNNSVLGAYNKTNINIPVIKNAVEWFNKLSFINIKHGLSINKKTTVTFIKNSKYKPIIVELLQKADFAINDIEIEKIEIFFKQDKYLKYKLDKYHLKMIENLEEIYFTHITPEGTFTLPYEFESAGTKSYFNIIGPLLDAIINDKILIIDELENSLHPDLLVHFLLTFLVNSEKSQLIATTHMRELLLEKDLLRKDIIWFTEKKEDHSTDLYSLADFEDEKLDNPDLQNVYYQFYKLGNLGAKPNLGNYFLNLNKYRNEKKKE